MVPANTTAELWLPGADGGGGGRIGRARVVDGAQRPRSAVAYLPSREGARWHLDSPLAEVLNDEPARQILIRRNRAFGVLMRTMSGDIPAMSLREALQSSPRPVSDKRLAALEQDLIRL